MSLLGVVIRSLLGVVAGLGLGVLDDVAGLGVVDGLHELLGVVFVGRGSALLAVVAVAGFHQEACVMEACVVGGHHLRKQGVRVWARQSWRVGTTLDTDNHFGHGQHGVGGSTKGEWGRQHEG